MLENLTGRVETANDGNGYLREAVDGNFSNGKRVEGKPNTERAVINNFFEKITNMEKKNHQRMKKIQEISYRAKERLNQRRQWK